MSRYATGTLADFADPSIQPTPRTEVLHLIQAAFPNRPFRLHRACADVLTKVDAITRSWSPEQREALYATARAIADAECARQRWEPKKQAAAYHAVARAGVDAASLVCRLCNVFPDSPPAITAMIAELKAFIDAALTASSTVEYGEEVGAARKALRAFRHSATGASISRRVLADLVIVVMGRVPGKRDTLFDESALRHRYERVPQRNVRPTRGVLRRAPPLLNDLARRTRHIPAKSSASPTTLLAAVQARLHQKVQ
jgi:hypothetical protein